MSPTHTAPPVPHAVEEQPLLDLTSLDAATRDLLEDLLEFHVEPDRPHSLHVPGCPLVQRDSRGQDFVLLALHPTKMVGRYIGSCCNHLTPSRVNLALTASRLEEVTSSLLRDEVSTPDRICSVLGIALLAGRTFPELEPLLVQVRSHVRAASAQLDGWAASTEALGLLDLLASIHAAAGPRPAIIEILELGGLTVPVSTLLRAPLELELNPSFRELALSHRTRDRSGPDVLLRAPLNHVAANELVSCALRRFELTTTPGLLRLPAALAPLVVHVPSPADVAALEPGDTEDVLETMQVLLRDGYPTVAAALSAARALDLTP